MTGQALDQLARRVILDTARLEYGVLLEEAPEHSFSPAFERKMKRLLRRGRHPVWYPANDLGLSVYDFKTFAVY